MVSVRMLEERRNLWLTMAEHEKDPGNTASANEIIKRAEEMKVHIERIKSIIYATGHNAGDNG